MGERGKMKEWISDKKWSDRFIPIIKPILGQYLIGEPPIEEDMERNTDLIVLKMEPLRIACRIRRPKFYFDHPEYRDEITIRTERPNGYKTELTKIIEGFGDFFFYGFSNKEENSLVAWKLCKLSVFRVWFMRELSKLDKGKTPGIGKENGDNSSKFRAFKVGEIPSFVYAESENDYGECPF
jgi:hypothetical protein